MEKEVKGIVKQNPVRIEQGCVFVVEQEQGAYLIISTDMQAVRDQIFVKKGQEIRIHGCCMENMDLRGVLVTKNAKITLRSTNREE